MEFRITDDLILTTDSPASSHGIPVLRHLGCGCGDYGPGDAVPDCLRLPAEYDNGLYSFAYKIAYQNMCWFLMVTIHDVHDDEIIDDSAESRAALDQWNTQLDDAEVGRKER